MATNFPTITTATGKAGSQNAVNTFIPIMWADEVLAQREKRLFAAKFFKRFNHKGKKGDTIRIPLITRGTATDKTETVAVIPTVSAEGLKSVSIDKHKYVARLFEDLLKIQSDYDLRAEYSQADAYTLAEAIDSDIFDLFDANLGVGYKVIGSDGTTAWSSAGSGNAADITDIGLRNAMQRLEDNNVDMADCALFIPPSQKNALLGIDKFTLYQNIGRSSEIQKGDFGEIYGIKVKVTTNVDTVTCADTTTTRRVAVLASKNSVCSVIQKDIGLESQRKTEYLGDLYVASVIYGVAALRTAVNDTTASNNRLSEAVAIYVP